MESGAVSSLISASMNSSAFCSFSSGAVSGGAAATRIGALSNVTVTPGGVLVSVVSDVVVVVASVDVVEDFAKVALVSTLVFTSTTSPLASVTVGARVGSFGSRVVVVVSVVVDWVVDWVVEVVASVVVVVVVAFVVVVVVVAFVVVVVVVTFVVVVLDVLVV